MACVQACSADFTTSFFQLLQGIEINLSSLLGLVAINFAEPWIHHGREIQRWFFNKPDRGFERLSTKKRATRHSEEKSSQLEATSNNTAKTENDLFKSEILTKPDDANRGKCWANLRWFEELENWRSLGKHLEKFHSAQIKDRSLLGHLVCSEKTQRKTLEMDIFRILDSEGVTEISPLKFVLVFGSKTAKPQGTEIQCHFGNSEIYLNFRKRIGPVWNGR